MNALEAKVQAVNEANAEANRLQPILQAIFAPLVGQKVAKVDGGLLTKVQKLLPEFPCKTGLSIYRCYANRYSLAFRVETCVSYGEYNCVYHDTMVYVGDLDCVTLTKLSQPCHHRTDYTATEIQDLRKVAAAAEQKACDAKSALYPFGEYDR